MAFNDFIERELPKRPFTEADGLPGQVPVRSTNPLAPREMVWVDPEDLLGTPGGGGTNKLELIAADNLSGHRVICSNGVGLARYASNDAPADAHAALGISTNAAVAGAPVTIQYAGKLVEPGWTWTPNMPVFCGVDGVLTQEAPTTGFVLIVGVATAATALVVGIKQPIITN